MMCHYTWMPATGISPEVCMIKIRTIILSALLASPVMVFADVAARTQDFRPPNIPGASESFSPLAGSQIQGTDRTQEFDRSVPDSTSSGFVPKATQNGLGLVPVRPRGGRISNEELQQLRPEYAQERTEEDRRILELLRSGNFADASPDNVSEREPQIITQRYPDGKVQLQRRVAQDSDGNYFNDGPWQLFNRQGELVASGQFANGVMDGTWERWHAAGSGGMFQTNPFTEFEGPFVSTATFSNGKLEGVWVINDRHQRKIVEVPYTQGKRNGTATWWHPNSQRMRSMNFKDDLLDGPLLEWDDKDQLVRNDEYIAGQKVIRLTSFFRPQQKSSETFFLDGQLTLAGSDNWWDAEPAEYKQNGAKSQHGPTVAWHTNGQRKMVGQYQNDVRVGQFHWWHENGTRALVGRFEAGRKVGLWTWWHDNGMKSIEGSYENDQPVGAWNWWNSSGQVENQQDFGENAGTSGVLVEPADSSPETDEDSSDQDDIDLKTNPPQSGIDLMEEIRPDESIEIEESAVGESLDPTDSDSGAPNDGDGPTIDPDEPAEERDPPTNDVGLS